MPRRYTLLAHARSCVATGVAAQTITRGCNWATACNTATRKGEHAMGFMDSLKKKIGQATNAVSAPPPAAPPPQEEDQVEEVEEAVAEASSDEQFDTAGFDPLGDEAAFFNAVLHMES